MTRPAKRALVIGAGGLGCPSLIRLASRGVEITVIDDDVVDETNLARQVLFTDADVGRLKVEAARDALSRRFPEVLVTAVSRRLTADDEALFTQAGVVLDGTDNFPTRFLANALAVRTRTPLVHGAAIAWQGQILTILPGVSACLACVFEAEPPPGAAPRCSEAGVIAPLVGIVGEWMAEEALFVLDGKRPPTADAMRVFDARTGRRRVAAVGRDVACGVCGRVSAGENERDLTPFATHTLDVSAQRCPMTWVRTRLALESLVAGEVLEVVLGPGEMLDNVPRNARDEGFFVDGPEAFAPDRHRMLVRRAR